MPYTIKIGKGYLKYTNCKWGYFTNLPIVTTRKSECKRYTRQKDALYKLAQLIDLQNHIRNDPDAFYSFPWNKNKARGWFNEKIEVISI